MKTRGGGRLGEVGIEMCAFVICDFFLIFFWRGVLKGKGG